MSADIAPPAAPVAGFTDPLAQLLNVVDQLGAMMQALLDTRLLCAACLKEHLSLANAGIGLERLPPVNLANTVDGGIAACGNHLPSAQKTLWAPGQ